MQRNERRDWINDFLERHGLPTLLLLLGAWYISSNVIEPMASTAKQFITDIREANVIIQDELMQIDRENLSRWDKAFALVQQNREMALRVEPKIDALSSKTDSILLEFEKIRMLFTEPYTGKEPRSGRSDNTPEDAAEEE